jgi:hypothetical protein
MSLRTDMARRVGFHAAQAPQQPRLLGAGGMLDATAHAAAPTDWRPAWD